MPAEEAFLEALMLRKAEEGLVVRILERFSSLLFLSLELAALMDLLRAALARQRFSLALVTASWLGAEVVRESRAFLNLRTDLSSLLTSGQTYGFSALVLESLTHLLVEAAANERQEYVEESRSEMEELEEGFAQRSLRLAREVPMRFWYSRTPLSLQRILIRSFWTLGATRRLVSGGGSRAAGIMQVDRITS